jgi:hypothetical protein
MSATQLYIGPINNQSSKRLRFVLFIMIVNKILVNSSHHHRGTIAITGDKDFMTSSLYYTWFSSY